MAKYCNICNTCNKQECVGGINHAFNNPYYCDDKMCTSVHRPLGISTKTGVSFEVGKTHWQGHQDPSKSIPIFLRGTEANLKMVPISRVPIPR